MVRSESGLVVTAGEHGEGWGRVDCAGCHALPTTHDYVCTEQVDGEALRALVAERGVDSCADCHGTNGVSP
jgi:mono/diheme cytochrome c family protein